MEEKTKFYSCRLAVHHDSGRVRWRIGQEKNWRTKIKLLVFLPLILLSLVVIIIFVSRAIIASKKVPVSEIYLKELEKSNLNESIRRDKRDESSYEIKIEMASDEDSNEPNIPVDVVKKTIVELREKFSKINITYDVNNKKSTNRPFLWNNKKNSSEIRRLQSELMRNYMNDTVDPCNNFYEFSCGNWKNYYTIPPDKGTYDTFEVVRENLDYALKDLLHTSDEEIELINNATADWNYLTEGNDTLDATIKVKNLYKSCMQEEIIQRRSDKPLQNILKELNNWPIIYPNWNESSFDLVQMLAKLRLLSNDILITQWVAPDMKNSTEYIIHIDQTSLGLPSRDYYLEESNAKYLKAYRMFILTIATLLGANYDDAQRDVNEIIEFEIELSRIMASPEERRNLSEVYLRTNIAALRMQFLEFDWKEYFDVVLGKDVDDDTRVACYCSSYLYHLFKLIDNTEPRILQNYLIWRFVRHRANNLDNRFMDAKQKFFQVLFGSEKRPPRWQFCVAQVNSNMGMALGALFVKKYFNKISRTDTVEMTERLAEAFLETLLENNWLDNNTKNYARMKINEIDLKIGYPDFILNSTELTEEYSDVKIHPNYFFENILSILRHLTRVQQNKLGTTVNRTFMSTPPTVVNAYYSRNKNQIMFPAGMLQPPFYHRYFPKALNFGGIGVVIGHEITHGFDNKGRLFDYRGNLHLWWSEMSIKNFYERSRCMIDQYNQYILPDIKMPLDGQLTQGENIADNGGLKQSFRAYEKWLESNPQADETLPNLNYTGKQLFFLNFAQAWCGQQRVEAAKSRLKTSVHAPGIFRVIGVLSNSEEFSRVFNCPNNSTMNPEKKCTVW